MYCKKCGHYLSDDSIFCSKCGTKIELAVTTILESQIDSEQALEKIPEEQQCNNFDAKTISESISNAEKTETTDTVPKKKLSKLLLCVCSGILILAIMGALSVYSVLARTRNTSNAFDCDQIAARMNADGTAYIPMMDGTHVTINDDVKRATLTNDKKTIVVLLKDGTLYTTTPAMEEKHVFTSNCALIFYIRNDGLIYKDKENNYYRIMFADNSILKIGEDIDVLAAKNNISVLWGTSDGSIYSLAADSTEKAKLGTIKEKATLEAISDDGQTAVWETKTGDESKIVIYENDDKFTAGETGYGTTYTHFSQDQQMIVITNKNSKSMWIKKKDEEPVEVKLGAGTDDWYIFTESGYFDDSISNKVSSLYISTDADNGSNVYSISINGDRERVLSGVEDYTVTNNTIVYLNDDHTLFCAKLHGSTLEDEYKISSDVDTFIVSDNGKYIYYIKDGSDTGSLYCYKIGSNEPKKISTDVAFEGLITSFYINISTDGETVYFFKDFERIDDTYSFQGTLMMWSYGDESPVRIASEVIAGSITSATENGGIISDSLTFLKYSYADDENNVFANWMYFDGEEAVRFASDVIK